MIDSSAAVLLEASGLFFHFFRSPPEVFTARCNHSGLLFAVFTYSDGKHKKSRMKQEL